MSHNFLGGKTIINLGITSWNVILWNVNVTSHKVRRHDLLCVGCNVMTSYVKVLKWCVSLRRMLVCCRELYVWQRFPVISMMDREHLSQLFCYWGTRWWNILKLKYEQQRCRSSITSDWWTIYVCWIFCYWVNSFIKTFLLLTEWDVFASTITDATFFVIRPSSSSFATWSTNTHHFFTRFVEDFHIQTTAETLNRA